MDSLTPLGDNTRINGLSSFTRSDGTTGLVADARTGFDPNGFRIKETVEGFNIEWQDHTIDRYFVAAATIMAGPGITMDLAATGYAGVFGSAGNDIFTGANGRFNFLDGQAGADILTGKGGNDILIGGTGADELRGGDGDDVLVFDANDTVVDGGAGYDAAIFVGSSGVTFNLGAHATEMATGSEAADTLDASQVSNAVVIANAGNDIVLGGSDGDVLFGGAGNDTISGGGEGDLVIGDEGSDTLDGGDGDDVLEGGAGADALIGGTGSDTASYYLAAGAIAASLTAPASFNIAEAQGDTYSGIENIIGSMFNDLLVGDGASNVLTGLSGNDTLNGGGGNDTMEGRGGDDLCYVDSASDVVIEAPGGGTDRVHAIVSYALAGGQEIETLSTSTAPGTAAINLTGNGFANTLIGNAGANFLNGGAGGDVIVTHGGNDTIRFNTALGASNIDTINDLDIAKDIIQLENAIFIELTTNTGNALSGGEFFIGSAAHDADDRIIYNSATGALIYDANGNAANGATQFATLATGLALTSADFFVI